MESEPQKQNVKAVESVADWIIGLVNSSPDPENRIDNVPAHEASPDQRPGRTAYDGLQRYRDSILSLTKATASENRDLMMKLRVYADIKAETQLLEGNMHLVLRQAAHFAKLYPAVDEQDLITAGYEGLHSAVDHFDLNSQTPFASFAPYWIKQTMQRYIMDNMSVIRIPANLRFWWEKLVSYLDENNLQVNSFDALSDGHIANLMHVLQIQPRSIPALFSIPVKMIDPNTSFLSKKEKTLSIFEFYFQAQTTENDYLRDSEDRELKRKLFQAIKKLDPRGQTVIIHRYGLFGKKLLTQEEISQIIGRTKGRVGQIENQVLEILKGELSELALTYSNYMRRLDHGFIPSFERYQLVSMLPDDLEDIIYDILDSVFSPLNLQEIRQTLNYSFPGKRIPDFSILKILAGRKFTEVVNKNGSVAWKVNEDVFSGRAVEMKTKVIKTVDNFDSQLEFSDNARILSESDLSDDRMEDVISDSDPDLNQETSVSGNPADDIIKMFSI